MYRGQNLYLKDHTKIALIWNGEPIDYSLVIKNVNKSYSLIENISAEKIAIFSENRPE